MTPTEIVETLYLERHRRRLTLKQVVATMRLASHASLSQWENGKFFPNVNSLDVWARALGYELTLTPLDDAHSKDGAAA